MKIRPFSTKKVGTKNKKQHKKLEKIYPDTLKTENKSSIKSNQDILRGVK